MGPFSHAFSVIHWWLYSRNHPTKYITGLSFTPDAASGCQASPSLAVTSRRCLHSLCVRLELPYRSASGQKHGHRGKSSFFLQILKHLKKIIYFCSVVGFWGAVLGGFLGGTFGRSLGRKHSTQYIFGLSCTPDAANGCQTSPSRAVTSTRPVNSSCLRLELPLSSLRIGVWRTE